MILKHKFIRFLIVGGFNTAFGYMVYGFFIFLGFHYTIAILLATAIGVLFNYQTTGRIVFHNNNKKLFLRFIGVYTIVYLVNIAGLMILNNLFQLHALLAGALLVLPIACLSFLLNKKFVFEVEK